MSHDSTGRTLLVAVVVCVVCSILVSAAATGLKPVQDRNKSLDLKRNILLAAGLLDGVPDADVDALFETIETRVVDLGSGAFLDDVDPATVDCRKAFQDPAQSEAIEAEDDLAGICRRPNQRLVYLVRQGDRIQRIVLPVCGKGLWSTMYGLVALGEDLETIEHFGFYEHAETPGLGGEVDNPKWKAIWIGKKVFDDQGRPTIEVIKGHVDAQSPEAEHQVDGLAGATLTGRGVMNLVRFWLGDGGYGPMLNRLKGETP